MIIVLVVVAVGGLAFLLTSGDDDDDTAGNPGQQLPGGGGDAAVTTLPGGDIPIDPPDVTFPDAPEDPDVPDVPSGDVQEMTAAWVFGNTPSGVDQTESACIAEVVILIVGEDEVGADGGDLDLVYGGTTFEQDNQIRSGISTCVDSDSATALAADPDWHWAPE